jgi:hypothetical protein
VTTTDIMNDLVELYASCLTYADAGEVVRWNTIDDKPLPDVVFKTVFIRPSKLRFSFTSQWGNSKVFSDESITFTSHQFRDALERNVSIREALNGVSGITMGAAKEVPTLLIPALRDEQIGFRSLIQTLKNVELSTSQQIDGEDCHCLVSSYDLAATSSISLWVSKGRSHLKQIQEISFFPPDTEHVLGEHWSTLISYKALRFNEDIDLQELERGD